MGFQGVAEWAEYTASAAVTTNKTKLLGVTVTAPTDNAATVAVKDGGSGGTTRWTITASADTTAGGLFPGWYVMCETSLYVDLTGTGAKVTVFWTN
jgi:hypothetical protein